MSQQITMPPMIDPRITMSVRDGEPLWIAFLRPETDGYRVRVESHGLEEVEWYLALDDRRAAKEGR